jgi:hypothetical protein
VEEGEQSAWGSRVHCWCGYSVSGGMSRGIIVSLVHNVVEVQASGSLDPTIEVHITQFICARFGNPVLSHRV